MRRLTVHACACTCEPIGSDKPACCYEPRPTEPAKDNPYYHAQWPDEVEEKLRPPYIPAQHEGMICIDTHWHGLPWCGKPFKATGHEGYLPANLIFSSGE